MSEKKVTGWLPELSEKRGGFTRNGGEEGDWVVAGNLEKKVT